MPASPIGAKEVPAGAEVEEGADDSTAGAVTAPPQDGQKRTPAGNGFPQCVQNWAMAAFLQTASYCAADL